MLQFSQNSALVSISDYIKFFLKKNTLLIPNAMLQLKLKIFYLFLLNKLPNNAKP